MVRLRVVPIRVHAKIVRIMVRHHHLPHFLQDGDDMVGVVVDLLEEHPMLEVVQIPQIQMKIHTVERKDWWGLSSRNQWSFPRFHMMQLSADLLAINLVWFAKWLKAMKPQCSIGSVNVTLLRKKPCWEPMTFQCWIVGLVPSFYN